MVKDKQFSTTASEDVELKEVTLQDRVVSVGVYEVKDGNGETTNRIVYENGDTYTGDIDEKTEKRHGHGKYVFANSDAFFEGTYEMDCRVNGTVSYGEDKGKYNGDFKNGMRDGQGTYNYANGDVYEGHWQSNERSGPGKYSFKESGCSLTTTWHNGNPEPGSKGCWTYSDGKTCEGIMDAGAKMTGLCTIKDSKGSVVATGSFVDGVWKAQESSIVKTDTAADSSSQPSEQTVEPSSPKNSDLIVSPTV